MNCTTYFKNIAIQLLGPGLQELEILVRFFMHQHVCIHNHTPHHIMCTSNSHLCMYICTLTCTLLCTHYRDRNILEQKLNLRSAPQTINIWVSRLLLQRKKQQNSLLLSQNQTSSQTTFHQLGLNAINIFGPSQC